MDSPIERAVAIVGVGAILPDAPDAATFWQNILARRYSITETPPDRWSVADYYDPDPAAPDKTYSKIGGWVRGFCFDWQRFRIPPKVAAAMDEGQQWALTAAAAALADYGFPERALNTENTGVILGTAMGGELHYATNHRIEFPKFARALEATEMFGGLPAAQRAAILEQFHAELNRRLPPITEDTMPGELANIVAGRIANVLNLRGPNFIADAACASTFAAIDAAVEMLDEQHVDAVLTGGVDRNMGASSFVKFCKIGALSATGTRPFGSGADGFVMGEGTAVLLLKRLADAERDGDRIYAVIRGVGASSDGRGKGITAPNPVGQVYAVERAWRNAGLNPATATLVEAHGTSTRVGDVTEVESLTKVFGRAERGRIGLGSVKSNIGHLKAGAGAAGVLKATLALHHKILPPTLNCEQPNPNIDFDATPFYLLHEAREWERPANGAPRRAGVSAYGFGGTNFHAVLEEYVPGLIRTEAKRYTGASFEPGAENPGQRTKNQEPRTENREPRTENNGYDVGAGTGPSSLVFGPSSAAVAPLRGILALGAESPALLKQALEETIRRVEGGWTPPQTAPAPEVLRAPERLLIDFGTREELQDRLAKALKAASLGVPAAWKPLQAQGVFRGSGAHTGKLAFLFPGQGSQYINMGRELLGIPEVRAVFDEADRVMTPILGRPLTSYLFVDERDEAALQQAERDLRQTAITQPAMLTLDIALLRLLERYGFAPDVVMGHSLGEYAALVTAGIMPFAEALEAAAARGSEMTRVSVADPGWMAAVMAPLDVIQSTLPQIDGYVVAANINSSGQAVIGGESAAVERAIAVFTQQGYQAQRIPVSHAFHTRIVAPASKPLRQVLDRLHIREPRLPLVANVTGGLYPTTVVEIKNILEQQIAAPVQWVRGLETLYAEGARVFVEVGPKKALKGFVDDVLGGKPDVTSLFTNHPKTGTLASFNQALCGLYAAGCLPGGGRRTKDEGPTTNDQRPTAAFQKRDTSIAAALPVGQEDTAMQTELSVPAQPLNNLGQLLVQALGQLAGQAGEGRVPFAAGRAPAYDRNSEPSGSVVISGTGLGLPGSEKPVMDPDNALRILRGEQFVDLIPDRFRALMLQKHITRLVKDADGGGRFETLDAPEQVIRLAGRPGPFDLAEEYGVPAKLIEALDITSQLAMAAGLDALREAGIPLVQTFRPTSTGRHLPDRWALPEPLRDETGVIFASAFPGMERMADEFGRYYAYESRRARLAELEQLRQLTRDEETLRELLRREAALREELEREPYTFDRRFIFRILAMGHSQFAEYIGARGPNTHVNAACASTTQAVALAEDWIRSGRCRRVIVLGADDVTGDRLLEWIGSGFLASGAAATDDRVAEAALPFDRRRHGTILGMGACALVLESQDAVRERGMRGIVELLASETSNSAFHGTRLDVEHIALVVNNLVGAAERRFGLDRRAMAEQTVFVSHETFTPARGGSAAAEVLALRRTFGEAAGAIVVANTKGFTGHPMGVGIEDVIAVKILEHGIVPPVPNYREPDPDLGPLTLSRGGHYPVRYAIHLAAGFGSQLALTLTRRIPGALDRVDDRARYDYWLSMVSGYDRPATEVVKRTLRVRADGLPQRLPAPSAWRYGTGPTERVQVSAEPAPERHTSVVLTQVAVPPLMPTLTPVPPSKGSGNGSGNGAYGPANDQRPTTNDQQAVGNAQAVAAEAGPSSFVVRPSSVAEAGPSSVVVRPSSDPATERVLAIVAEKTGYPRDMLDPDLDLEADLGVDTVKQAEMFTAVREAFGIPRIEGMRLRDYPTLASVIGFVRQHRPDLAVPTNDQRPTTNDQRPTTNNHQPAASNHQPTTNTQMVQVEAAPSSFVFGPSSDPVAERVLAIIAEKTGYPPEMLDLDLDMEADLGVDTVKQAETFAAVREAFDIPRVEGLKLRDYPTLASVIGFVRQHRPDLAVPTNDQRPTTNDQRPTTNDRRPTTNNHQPAANTQMVQVEATPSSFVFGPSSDPVAERVLAIIAEKTGYPPEMLDLDLDLEADLGVDTVKQAETFAAVREAFAIPRVEGLKLRDYPTLASVIGFVRQHRPDLAVPTNDQRPTTNDRRPTTDDQQKVANAQTVAVEAGPSSFVVRPSSDPVAERVLVIIAEKTGYPPEMLDLDLDLEADLGVDTVKQAETFAAVREAFAIPRVEGLRLRDYPTLASVIGFVHQHRPDLAVPTNDQRPTTNDQQSVANAQTAQVEAAASSFVLRPSLVEAEAASSSFVLRPSSVEDADLAPRRVPVPALRLGLELCKATGVSLEPGSRVLVMMDSGGVGRALVSRLEKRGVTALAFEEPPSQELLDERLAAWLAEGPVQGVYWLAALDVEPGLEELDLAAWRELNRVRVKNLYRTMRALYESVSAPGCFLVAATRLGGLHGYERGGASAPLGGAVSGFAKAYKRERPDVLVKVVDFEPGRKTVEPAETLIAETLFDPGLIEVGHRAGLRYGISLEERPAADGQPGLALGSETVFVVTGAAGGITSAIVADLAAASGGVFYLLDLTPAPKADDPHIALFRQDRQALKQVLIEEARARGERPTPVQIDAAIAATERAEAALRAIESVAAAGGTPFYYSVNLLDGPAIAAVIDDVRARCGRIDVLLHAGGIEISKLLPAKEPREFDLVFDIKADGFFNLLKAAQGLPIGAAVAFSSVAGRFGNTGQTDYSAANDLLCKVTSSMRAWRPATRGIVIDWTAWGGIGMATRGSIPKMMEQAGIDMLPPEIGVPTIRRELTRGATRDELVVGQRLGLLVQELDPQGGIDPAKVAQTLGERAGLMVGGVPAARLYGALEVETTLDPRAQPFLYDHQIEGVPVLPGVMGTEAFVELARLLAPGFQLRSAAVEFQRPLKFHRHEPRTLYLSARATPAGDGTLLLRAELRSRTQLKPDLPPQQALHFVGTLRLAAAPPQAPRAELPHLDQDARVFSREEIYQVYFHGPAYRVLERVAVQGRRAVGVMAEGLPASVAPADAPLYAAPLLIELCFQTVGILESSAGGALTLPRGFESVEVYRLPEQAEGARLYAAVSAAEDGSFEAQVLDEAGNVYVALAGYRTVAMA